MKYKPIVLIILDGWGISPRWSGNALTVSNTPNFSLLWREFPHDVLKTHFSEPALLDGATPISDSRFGHSTIAAGRKVSQDSETIDLALKNNQFFHNKILRAGFAHSRQFKSNIHFIGLISDGGIHSHLNHLLALLTFAQRENYRQIFLDLITDGIDSAPSSALESLAKVKTKLLKMGFGKISSLVGRQFALDRTESFQKTIPVLEMLVLGKAKKSSTAEKAILSAYQKHRTDAMLEPTLIENPEGLITIKDNDVLIFFNFRSDGLKKLIQILTGKQSPYKKTSLPKNLKIITFSPYGHKIAAEVVFPRAKIEETLGEILSSHNLKQLRVAETIKYSHVTSFFSCGQNQLFPNETRRIFPTPATSFYNEVPGLAAEAITQEVTKTLTLSRYDFILVNFANVDILAHTGNFLATCQGAQIVDRSLMSIVNKNLALGGATIITSDHGNAEEMTGKQKSLDNWMNHTFNPVPFILVTPDHKKDLLAGAMTAPFSALTHIFSKNTLADVAPTILELIGLPKPTKMTGHSLLSLLR